VSRQATLKVRGNNGPAKRDRVIGRSVPGSQRAHAAVHTKETYLSAFYRRLAARRGKKRTIHAVAHAIMVSAFYMLACNEPYHELGGNYFDERRRHSTVDRLAARLGRLGYRVHLEPVLAHRRVSYFQGNPVECTTKALNTGLFHAFGDAFSP
jgi:hypothetical protein